MRTATWFKKMHPVYAVMLCLGMLVVPAVTLAQEAPVAVPDVIGLSVPEAAAVLNRSGIVLGTETNINWTPESGLEQNTVGAQSIPAGEAVPAGTVVDVTVLRSPNAVLIYDDNDLTLVNLSGSVMGMEGIVFRSTDGSQEASFTAGRWTGALSPNDCAQIWSVPRNGPKDLPECPASTFWFTTQYEEAHFWTGAFGATQFHVEQNGIERAVCPVANPGRCEFYLATGSIPGDIADYVYFAYTTDQLIVRDAADNRWMVLDGVQIINNAPAVTGSTFAFGDPAVFGNPPTIGRINRLAPGQCLQYTGSAAVGDSLPEPCDVVARLDLDPNVNFWVHPFGVDSVTDDEAHVCPGATPSKLTICLMPR